MEILNDYITSKEAAKMLRVTQATMCRWRTENRYNLPYISNRVLYKLRDIQEFMKKHQWEDENNAV